MHPSPTWSVRGQTESVHGHPGDRSNRAGVTGVGLLDGSESVPGAGVWEPLGDSGRDPEGVGPQGFGWGPGSAIRGGTRTGGAAVPTRGGPAFA